MSKSILILFIAFFTACNSSPKPQRVVSDTQAKPPASSATNFPQNATISSNIDGGKYLILSDNSVWIVNPADNAISSLWLGPIYLDFSLSKNPDYPVQITNRSTKTSISAKKGNVQDIP